MTTVEQSFDHKRAYRLCRLQDLLWMAADRASSRGDFAKANHFLNRYRRIKNGGAR